MNYKVLKKTGSLNINCTANPNSNIMISFKLFLAILVALAIQRLYAAQDRKINPFKNLVFSKLKAVRDYAKQFLVDNNATYQPSEDYP